MVTSAAPSPATTEAATGIRVLLVDDHALFRRGLRELLSAHGFEVVGEASNGAAGAKLAGELKPDVVLMDLEMPGTDGRDATRMIVEQGLDARVLILTISVSNADVLEAITAGTAGYLLKDAEIDEIVAGVKAAAAGDSMISPSMANALVQRVREVSQGPGAEEQTGEDLTDRELEILRLVAEGRDNVEIAAELHLSPSTVKHHVASLLSKLGVDNRVQAAVFAVRNGLV